MVYCAGVIMLPLDPVTLYNILYTKTVW